MIEFDMLFSDSDTKRVSDTIFEDFSFDNIKKAVFPEDTVLFNNFREVLKYPLNDVEKIKERQLILHDFMNSGNLINDLSEVCAEVKLCRKLETRAKLYKKAITDDNVFGEKIEHIEALFILCERMRNILHGRAFSSQTLKKIQRYFAATENFDAMLKMVRGTETYIHTRYASLNITFNSYMNTKSAVLVSLEPPKMPLIQDKFKLFRKKQTIEEPFVRHGNYIISAITDEICEGKMCVHIHKMLTSVISAFNNIFDKMVKQLIFYKAALKLSDFFYRNGLDNVFPEFSEGKQIDAEGVYDFSFYSYLSVNSEEQKVTDNNFSTSGSDIFFVTGPNQGGKTTFLRSIGISQIFAQSGLPVPAKKYSCGVFNGIATHFPKPEDDNLDYGKLAEELMRLKEDFPMVKDGALVMLNESFATTTVNEGTEIACDFIKAAAKTDSVLFFVTHFYELALNAEKFSESLNKKITNLVADYKKSTPKETSATERTYKIIEGVPQKQVFASDLLR